MKLTYKKRIFFSFFLLFALFTFLLIVAEQKKEKEYKTEMMESVLSKYAEVVHSCILHENLLYSSKINKLSSILPSEIRITIITKEGKVLYDDEVPDAEDLKGYLGRPEIQKAIYWGEGTNIRKSLSTGKEFLYYAKYFPSYFVRVAVPYDVRTEKILKADNLFIYFGVCIFVLMLILLNLIVRRFNISIMKLKDLVTRLKENKELPENISFPEDDLGEIGEQLIDIFNQKEKNKKEIELEKEKLILHFQYAQEGVAIFNSNNENIYFNSYFIQYVSFIIDSPVVNIKTILQQEFFYEIDEFLEKDTIQNHFSVQIRKDHKIFNIQIVKFEDFSFEIILKDITKAENTRLIKQEMTDNITHELRTPITSIRAYLETMVEQKPQQELQRQFIDKAYLQSVRLSNLIEDISIINKIEEAGDRFNKENISLYYLVNEVRINLTDLLEKNGITLHINLDENLCISGNYNLIYSIFHNFMENSIKYGGENISIHVNNYMKDAEFLYFSYYDTGKGVEEKYLNRLFERFYRINEGRSRNRGGTGLGLSIVKNSVLLHEGTIQVKKHITGGLEFLFTLKRT